MDHKTKYIVIMTKYRSTKIVNFMTPRAGVLVLGRGHRSHTVKKQYFLKNRLHYFRAWIRKTKYVVMVAKQGSTKSKISSPPLGHGHMNHILVNMHYLLLFRYTVHWCFCIKGFLFCFPLPLLIFIYSMMRMLICKYELFWQEVSVESMILRWPLNLLSNFV